MGAGWFTLGDLVRKQAASFPKRTALAWPAGRMSFAQLDERTNRIANALSERGIRAGDRVALLTENSPAAVEWIFALAKLGSVAVPINVRLTPQEIAFILKDAGVNAFFAGRMVFAMLQDVLAGGFDGLLEGIFKVADVGGDIPLLPGWVCHDNLLVASAGRRGRSDPAPEEPAVILYTSGTTGRPKGCMLSHRAWLANGANIMATFGVNRWDVYLAALPLFHVAGLGMMIAHVQAGGTVLPFPKWDPEHAVHLAREAGATTTFLVPPMFGQLVEAASRGTAPRMRAIVGAAGFEPPDRIDAAERIFGATFYGIYGQTEAGNIVTAARGDEIRTRPGTYGFVLPLFDFRIVDELSRDVARGEVGELWLRGPSVMTGYWRNEAATQEAFRDGWLRTGDLFCLEDDGSLRMVDRAKYLIKTGGENVYPQEVELVILQHPSVRDAAVIGVPDPVWGETVKAFVVVHPDSSVAPEEISAWVRQRLAPYKRPRYVEFVDEIPRNHSGKVLKEILRERPVTEEQRVP